MKTIEIKNLVLQFDGDQVTFGAKREQCRQALELVNLVLQREPFGLGAQLVAFNEPGDRHPSKVRLKRRKVKATEIQEYQK